MVIPPPRLVFLELCSKLSDTCKPEDRASESDVFASFSSRGLKLNPLLEFLKISKILLKSLLQLADIKLLSVMWY